MAEQGSAATKSVPKVVPGERNVLVTSALPYVNNVPHLGNIIGCVLSADVYARYSRGTGANTCFVCGTDEYGTTTEQRAISEGLTPQQICEKYHAIHKRIYEWFDISTDRFGRTSTPKQTMITHEIFKDLDANGYICEDIVEQHYCPKCERFLADRFVEGICPLCGADGARGDQCDACQKLYNAIELKSPRCKMCSTAPEIRQSRHLFIDLPKLAPQLEQYIDGAARDGRWTANSVQVARAWLRDLRKRCITRDLKWGTPVPKEGYGDKVFYVWFDAPIGYISITAGLTDEWRDWWIPQQPEKTQVKLVQFMGKDNLPFHTIIFPATMLGTGKPWTLMHSISTTEYLNYEDDKFSKSRGVGVFGDDAIDTGIPSEVWRYYLLANRPEVSDSVFTWADLGDKCNSELLKNLGNFTNRGLSFVCSALGRVVPPAPEPSALQDVDRALFADVDKVLVQFFETMDAIRIKDGLKCVMDVSRLGNKYMQDTAPWVLVKTDRARCEAVMCIISNLTYLIAQIAEPFMPGFTRKVRAQMAIPEPATTQLLPRTFQLSLPAGHKLGEPSPIFRKLDDAELKAFRERFSGRVKNGAAPAAASSSVSPSAPSPAPTISPSAVRIPVDLRVGVIRSAENHPTAERLYVLQVDVGEQKMRQVVSGIKDVYPEKAALIGKSIVLVCNLKASKLRDVMSEGMVLTGQPDAEGATYALCTPENAAAAAPGTRVLGTNMAFDGAGKKPLDIKAFQKIPLNFTNGTLCLEAVPLDAVGPNGSAICHIVAPGVVNGKVK